MSELMDTEWIQKWHWFWAWQDDQEEAWLGQMSNQGLHLKALGLPGAYIFERGEAADMIYRLDFISNPKMDREQYFREFRQCGWEHIGESFGWQYFRKPAPAGKETGNLSDPQAKAAKFKRLLDILTTSIPVAVMMLWLVLSAPQNQVGVVMLVLLAAFVLLNLFIVFKLLKRLRELKS